MQTFLPYADFRTSLECLDNKRLGKQRVEAMQIINVLEGKTAGWKNHPAVLMWEGYVPALKLYHDIAIYTWLDRGFKNTMKFYYTGSLEEMKLEYGGGEMPFWFGNHDFHASHRSNLLRKDPKWYGQYDWWLEGTDLPYVWPV